MLNDSIKKYVKKAIPDIDPDENKFILHQLAHHGKLDLIIGCIMCGIPPHTRNKYNRKYFQYLEDWQNDYILRRIDAFRKGKIRVISDDRQPITPEMLEKSLNAGTGYDLDPKEYPNSTSTFKNYGLLGGTDTFYPLGAWSKEDIEKDYTVKVVGNIPRKVLGKTVVLISDTHWEHSKLHIPGGDILIHSGDMCMPWNKDLTDFIEWLGSQQHPHKILVCGNHDKLFQNNKDYYLDLCDRYNITYLEDSGVTIDGLVIWGSPWTPKRANNKNNAFTLPRKELMEKWNQIPDNVNILVTHCPPYSVGDVNGSVFKCVAHQSGDYGLYKTVNRLKELKIHCFGHVHYGRGMYKGTNGVYFINCAIDKRQQPFIVT